MPLLINQGWLMAGNIKMITPGRLVRIPLRPLLLALQGVLQQEVEKMLKMEMGNFIG